MDKIETKNIAWLARLRFNDEELESMSEQLTGILTWVDMLQSVDTSAAANIPDEDKPLRTRKDEVTTSNLAEELMKNASEPYEHFYTVPKMVE